MSPCTDYRSATKTLNGSKASTEPGHLTPLTSQRGSGNVSLYVPLLPKIFGNVPLNFKR